MKKVKSPALAGLFLALAILLPFITSSNPQLGNMFLPMHLPVILCGFILGPAWGASVGLLAPLLRSMLFSAPIFYPRAVIMSAELATYGLICGLLYLLLPKKTCYTYISLLGGMIGGRIIWGLISMILIGIFESGFGWQAFISGAVLSAIPGIIIQIVLIPPLVVIAKKHLKI